MEMRTMIALLLGASLLFHRTSATGDTWPIIGILSVPNYKQYPGDPAGVFPPPLGHDVYSCFVPAGYVKLVESGMGRAAILPCDGPWDEFESMVSSVNGFMFSGMFTDYQSDEDRSITPYGQRGKHIIDHVFERNEAGETIPLFAECKGFNMLAFFVSGVAYWKELIRDDIVATNWPAPIVFNEARDYINTQTYATASKTGAAPLLTKGNNLMNRHPYGILPLNYSRNANLTARFGPYLATTFDQLGVEFVSFVESSQGFPIYGAATHPEKVLFEWNPRILSPHTNSSAVANNWFGILLTDPARYNTRSFPDPESELATLSYSKIILPTWEYFGGEFRQCYFLPAAVTPTQEPAPTPTSSTPGSICKEARTSTIITAVGVGLVILIVFGILIFVKGEMRGRMICSTRAHGRSNRSKSELVDVAHVYPMNPVLGNGTSV